ncbi:MAG: DUF881 domain-containing protein [Bacillota bacterium]|nr:DUF881 domain-containing protein [Bacillota bacterium]
MKFTKWQIPITVVCLISGILLAIQLQIQGAKPPLTLKNQDLVSLIKDLEATTFELEDEIDALRQEVLLYEEEMAGGEVVLSQLQRQLTNLRDTAGLTEQKGPGITLIIDDNKSGADIAKGGGLENYYPDEYIVHYKSVLYLINELREASQAISVNNQRIVASTDVRCVGTVILVNTTRLAPPYEIKAIGNPDRLNEIISSSYEYSYLQSRGFPSKLTKEQELTIPAYRGTFRYNFAQIVEDGDI